MKRLLVLRWLTGLEYVRVLAQEPLTSYSLSLSRFIIPVAAVHVAVYVGLAIVLLVAVVVVVAGPGLW